MQTKRHSSLYLYYIFQQIKKFNKNLEQSLFKSLKFDCLSFNPIFSVHYTYVMAKQRLQRR